MTSLRPTADRQVWQAIQAILQNALAADQTISAFATLCLLVVLTEQGVRKDQLLHLRGADLYLGDTELKPLLSRLSELRPGWEKLYQSSPQAAAQRLQDTFRNYLAAGGTAPAPPTLTR